MTRTFIAIDPGEITFGGLARLQSSLLVGRAMAVETFHLTLAFLGDQGDDALEAVHEALSAVRATPFSLAISGLGTFGGNQPHTLWAGAAVEPGLLALQKSVVSAVRRAGVDLPSRRFVPHVTLARFRGQEGAAPDLARFIAANATVRLPPEPVTGFALYASTLRPGGARHEVLAQYPLV